ncbi:MAG TPA: GNAT family protein [candidate division Zixibacteria bacterium]|nr:GNAT family protein [candidate division Zixibacteria bacterium]
MSDPIIETERLAIRRALPTKQDAKFYFCLWTNPEVMVNVGFPNGLRTTEKQIAARLADEAKDAVFNRLLIVQLKKTKEPIGEAWMTAPDNEGVCETDVKLLPQFWGNKYGIEIKQALVDYLFENTACLAVKATPNRDNIASQKMQEAVGGKKVGLGVAQFPKEMRDYTCDVPYFTYIVTRDDWEDRKG